MVPISSLLADITVFENKLRKYLDEIASDDIETPAAPDYLQTLDGREPAYLWGT